MDNMKERLRKATDEAIEAINRKQDEVYSALMEEIELILKEQAENAQAAARINATDLTDLIRKYFETEDLDTVAAGLEKRLSDEGLEVICNKTTFGYMMQIFW